MYMYIHMMYTYTCVNIYIYIYFYSFICLCMFRPQGARVWAARDDDAPDPPRAVGGLAVLCYATLYYHMI